MKIKIIILTAFLFLFFGTIVNTASAQSFATDVIGSAGTFAAAPGGSMAWTIGEVTIETYSSSNNFFTQGFHQPSVEIIISPFEFFIPQGFSPNGDFVNDLFIIRGILKYPNNKILIYNRWGNKVFGASPYLNSWDGRCISGLRVGGDELPIGTYFYVLDLGDGTPIFKGTIYLNR